MAITRITSENMDKFQYNTSMGRVPSKIKHTTFIAIEGEYTKSVYNISIQNNPSAHGMRIFTHNLFHQSNRYMDRDESSLKEIFETLINNNLEIYACEKESDVIDLLRNKITKG